MLDVETLETAVDRAALRYDRDGDQHYDVITAFIKSMRGSDVDAALHYLARMIEAGEDPRFIARRLVILAVGGHRAGRPDRAAGRGRRRRGGGADRPARGADQPGPGGRSTSPLAPKSNAVIVGDRRGASPTYGPGWPARCRRTCATPTTRGAKARRTAQGYVYPHDEPGGVAAQQYPPDAVLPRTYYRPTRHGAEARLADLWDKLRALVRGT